MKLKEVYTFVVCIKGELDISANTFCILIINPIDITEIVPKTVAIL